MQPDDREFGPIVVTDHARGVGFAFPEGTWDIRFPSPWRAVASEEEDLWRWTAAGCVGRIRLRRQPRIQLEVDVTNSGSDVAQVEPPLVALSPTGTQVPWFGGAAGEVLQTLPDATVLWRQHRGSCVARSAGFQLFADPLLLRPGQSVSALWRRNLAPPASLVPEPEWVPRRRYLPIGEAMEVEHADSAVSGASVHIESTTAGSEVAGDAGLHLLSFLDARGTATVEVGWFAPLEELATSPAVLTEADPNLVAWLLTAAVDAAGSLDDLDTALGEALETPSAWGVLAGMRAATSTDLPVAAEVRRAARVVWEAEPDPGLRMVLITHGLLCGWEPEVVQGWLAAGSSHIDQVMSATPQEMLALIGFGRITSSTTVPAGRSVALAGAWLAACAESVMAAEWEHAVDVSRRRLMCALSSAPRAIDIAWLLTHSPLS